MDYKESLAYLNHLEVFGVQMGLERIEKLLKKLDMPQELYRTIHVTGTNGKGSVSAMLEGILRGSSLHTGMYVSPHLASYTERIRVDGQQISKDDFAKCLSTVRVYVDEMVEEGEESPTQFEVLTAVAFFYFAMRHVEYAVIEVGLGGLLDSTNVIVPEVSVITNVTMEHADKCGGTLEGIARHKAGIIKEGVPVVTAAKDIPLEILRKAAEEKNADIFVAGEDFCSEFVSANENFQQLQFTSSLLGLSKKPYEIPLLGIHQVENSSLAIMVAKLLHDMDERVNAETVGESLRMVVWPGRFERMDLNGQTIVLDGAHNPAGIAVLRESLDSYFPEMPHVFLLGILRDKDIDSMLKQLLRPEDLVVVTRPNSERAATAREVAVRAEKLVHHVEVYEDIIEALDNSLEIAGKEHLLVVAGSLYLIGSLREELLRRRGQLA